MSRSRQVLLVLAIFVGAWGIGLGIVRLYKGPAPPPPLTDEDVAQAVADPVGERLLADALAAVGDSYTFRSTIARWVDGQIEVVVEGRVSGDVQERIVTTFEGERHVLIAGDRRWERTSAQEAWVAAEPLDDAVHPLRALAGGKVITVDEDGWLEAVFPSETFGSGTGAVFAAIQLQDGDTIGFEYRSVGAFSQVQITSVIVRTPNLDIQLPA